VFDDRLEVRGSSRLVELVAVDRGHSAGDAYLLVPDARVAFCGDLLFAGCHPFLADGDLAGLRAALRALEATGANWYVPGHGPVGGVAALRALADYVDDLEQLSRAGMVDPEMPDAYRSWAFARFFAPNLAFCAAGGRQPEAEAAPEPGETPV
jgi:glyoxylase-like metal-dependent hydrolase (beta-lactamase superfamily II)